jgi:hypothetical protein
VSAVLAAASAAVVTRFWRKTDSSLAPSPIG